MMTRRGKPNNRRKICSSDTRSITSLTWPHIPTAWAVTWPPEEGSAGRGRQIAITLNGIPIKVNITSRDLTPCNLVSVHRSIGKTYFGVKHSSSLMMELENSFETVHQIKRCNIHSHWCKIINSNIYITYSERRTTTKFCRYTLSSVRCKGIGTEGHELSIMRSLCVLRQQNDYKKRNNAKYASTVQPWMYTASRAL
jgi:hypothetical protein